MATPHCPRCQADLAELATRCPACGSMLAGGKDVCPDCGVDLLAAKSRCPYCGEGLAASEYRLATPGPARTEEVRAASFSLGNALLTAGQVISLIACILVVRAGAYMSDHVGPWAGLGIFVGITYNLAIFVAFGRAKRIK